MIPEFEISQTIARRTLYSGFEAAHRGVAMGVHLPVGLNATP